MKGRKLYLGLIFILSVAVVYLLEAVAQDKGIALGNVVITAKDRPSEWQDIIASDASENQLRLIVDGVEVAFAKNRIYMENNLDIMLPRTAESLPVLPLLFQDPAVPHPWSHTD